MNRQMNSTIKKILLLGKIPETLINFFKTRTDKLISTSTPVDPEFIKSNRIDFIISYRYRHIILSDIIQLLPKRIINLHISFLPWNRGADPNLWSFLEDTPKGVSIHLIDASIDTGDILLQKAFEFDNQETLASTYEILNRELLNLLMANWNDIIEQKIPPAPQDRKAGSTHRLKDKEPYLHLLAEKGWDTEVGAVRGKVVQ